MVSVIHHLYEKNNRERHSLNSKGQGFWTFYLFAYLNAENRELAYLSKVVSYETLVLILNNLAYPLSFFTYPWGCAHLWLVTAGLDS